MELHLSSKDIAYSPKHLESKCAEHLKAISEDLETNLLMSKESESVKLACEQDSEVDKQSMDITNLTVNVMLL
ncbi:uncharacterized protein DS421_19g636930 [Arachis hypogaea]|uniref:Uncharacterized protein n=1 Tax=Arachis hypogaea TaxID=3818 RepID=A0A6B9V435_ARAHY|nr:uncharacterized protein DS421_19g636930 [Arachis hypogaea]